MIDERLEIQRENAEHQGDLVVEAMADAIDQARYRHPTHPRERPRPFSEADNHDREYALRLARAAFRAYSALTAGHDGGARE